MPCMCCTTDDRDYCDDCWSSLMAAATDIADLFDAVGCDSESTPERFYQQCRRHVEAIRKLEAQQCQAQAEMDADIDDDDEGRWFANFYECTECDVKWRDDWHCGCDSECPKCRRDYTVLHSIELDGEGSGTKHIGDMDRLIELEEQWRENDD